jgi:hypothetical protein
VLGRRATSSNGSGANGAAAAAERGVLLMEAVALSNDHNAREPVEQAKLRALHPFEADIIKYVVLHYAQCPHSCTLLKLVPSAVTECWQRCGC